MIAEDEMTAADSVLGQLGLLLLVSFSLISKKIMMPDEQILAACGIFGICLLAAFARLMSRTPDDEPITRRAVFKHFSTSLLAGIVVTLVTYYYTGPSVLLFAVAGVGGLFADRCLLALSKVLDGALAKVGIEPNKDK